MTFSNGQTQQPSREVSSIHSFLVVEGFIYLIRKFSLNSIRILYRCGYYLPVFLNFVGIRLGDLQLVLHDSLPKSAAEGLRRRTYISARTAFVKANTLYLRLLGRSTGP